MHLNIYKEFISIYKQALQALHSPVTQHPHKNKKKLENVRKNMKKLQKLQNIRVKEIFTEGSQPKPPENISKHKPPLPLFSYINPTLFISDWKTKKYKLWGIDVYATCLLATLFYYSHLYFNFWFPFTKLKWKPSFNFATLLDILQLCTTTQVTQPSTSQEYEKGDYHQESQNI